MDAVAEKIKAVKPGEWIRGVGWDEGYLEECRKNHSRRPSKQDLDPVSPDNPVYLGDYSVHELWVNSKALELAGITAPVPRRKGRGRPHNRRTDRAFEGIAGRRPCDESRLSLEQVAKTGGSSGRDEGTELPGDNQHNGRRVVYQFGVNNLK